MRRMGRFTGSIILVAVVAASGCGQSHKSTTAGDSLAPAIKGSGADVANSVDSAGAIDHAALEAYRSTYESGTSTAKVVILPSEEYGTIQTLATSPTSAGVWAWVASETDSRVWHYDATSKTSTSWSLGSSGDVMGSVSFPQLVACGDEAWFGSGHTLIRISSTAGVTERLVVPKVDPIPQVDAYRPANLKGRSAVDALACSSSQLVVGLSDSTTAQILDLKSHTFSPIPLPSGFEVGSAAIEPSGNLAFGIRSYGPDAAATANRVIQMDVAGKIIAQTDVADSSHLILDKTGLVVGATLQRIDAKGAIIGTGLPTTAMASNLPPNASPPIELTDDRLVAINQGSVLTLIDPAKPNPTTSVDLGTDICGVTMLPMAPVGTTIPHPSRCPVGTRFFDIDGANHLYVVPTNGGTVPVLQVDLPTD